jgi:hypothetical protein
LSCCIPALSSTIGTVVTSDGKPIPDAKVVVASYNGKNPTFEILSTDKDGKFAFETKDWASVQAVAKGYAYREFHWTTNASAQMVLSPEKTLNGRIVDEQGKPISGVAVVLESLVSWGPESNSQSQYHASPGSTDPMAAEMNAVTAKDGTFALLHLPETSGEGGINANIRFSKSDRASVTRFIMARDLYQSLDVVLPKGCTILGTVSLPAKSGFAPVGTTVIAQVTDGAFKWQQYNTKVETGGKFKLTQLPPGKYTVAMPPFSQGRTPIQYVVPAPIGVDAASTKPTTLRLIATVGSTIKGKVVNTATGKPFLRATLKITDVSRSAGSPFSYVETNDKGEFSFPVSPGQVTIGVSSCQVDQNRYINFQTDDMTTRTFTVANRHDRSDLLISVDTSTTDMRSDGRAYGQIPPDFELSSGKYKLTWSRTFNGDNTYQGCKYKDQSARVLVKKTPKLVSSKPKFMAFKVDSDDDKDLLLVVFDESKGTGKGYDRVFIDRNRNRDLSDDKPVQPQMHPNYGDSRTPWVEIPSHQGARGSAQTHNPVSVTFTVTGGMSSSMIKRGGWRGTVDSNKGKIAFAASDSNNDAIYGEKISASEGDFQYGDIVFADTNGAGGIASGSNSKHAIRLNEVNALAGKLYQIKVSSSGDSVSIERYTGSTGKLNIKGENVEGMSASMSGIALHGQAGIFSTENLNGEAMVLPAGSYKVDGCTLNLAPKSGKSLSIYCILDNRAEVKPGEETVVVIGGKITGAISPKASEVILKAGQSNTVYWLPTINNTATIFSFGNGDAQYRPKVEFFDSENKLVYTSSADYT